MALTFRAPVEEVIARFTSEEQSTIFSHAVKGIRTKEVDNHDFFNFALSHIAKERLSESGIYLSPASYVPHSHPVCKTLENHILYNVLPSYVNGDFFFVGIKNYKLAFLKQRAKKLNLVSTINRFVTSLDKTRYSNELVVLESQQDCSILRHRGLYNSRSLRSLLPEAIKLKARYLFLHDELHYWSNKDLIYFLEELRPEKLLASIVIPPELLAKSPESLNPWAYQYKIKGKKLIFAPDGVWTESYEQPALSSILLKTKRIKLSDGSFYNLDVVHSKFCHHLISITKGDLINQESRHFSGFDAVGMKSLNKYSNTIKKCFPIHIDIVTKIYLYLRTLKKPDMESAEAKLRQLRDRPTGREIKFVEDFAKLVLECYRVPNCLNVSKIKRFVYNMMPHCLGSFLAFYNSRSLADFVYELESFTFSVNTIDMTRDLIEELTLDTLQEQVTDLPVPELIDNVFELGAQVNLERESQAYTLEGSDWMHPIHEPYHKFQKVNPNDLVKAATYFAIKRGVSCYSRDIASDLIAILGGTGRDGAKTFRGGRVFEMVTNGLFPKIVDRNIWNEMINAKRLSLDSKVNCSWFLNPNRVGARFICNEDSNAPKLLEKVRKNYEEIINLFKRRNPEFTGPESKHGVREAESADGGVKGGGKGSYHIDVEPSIRGSTQSMDVESGLNLFRKKMGNLDHEAANVQKSEEGERGKGSCPSLGEKIGEELEIASSIVAQNTTLQNFDFRIWGGLLSEASHFLGSMTSSLKIDLCDCFSCSGYHSHREWAKNLSCAFRSARLATIDCCLIIKHEGKSRCNSLITLNGGSAFAMQIKGEAELFTRGVGQDEKIVKIKKNGPAFDVTGVRSISKEGLLLIGIQTERVRSGRWEAHKEECPLSGSSQLIYGCPVTFSRNLDIADFNVFEVPGDGNCFWHSIGFLLGVDGLNLKSSTINRAESLDISLRDLPLADQVKKGAYAEKEIVALFCKLFSWRLTVITPDYGVSWNFGEESWRFCGFMVLINSHYQPIAPSNGCVIRAVASALGRVETDVLNVLCKDANRYIFDDVCRGKGLNVSYLEETFKIFDIEARCDIGGRIEEFNKGGGLVACFTIVDGHMEHVPEIRNKSVVPKIDALRAVSKNSINTLVINGTKVKYTPSLERANCLQENLLSGNTGVISSTLFNGCDYKDLEAASGFGLEREIIIILGTFGSGKSWLYKEFIQSSPGKNIIFVSPRRSLADQIKEDIGVGKASKYQKLSGVEVITFEVFIKRASNLKKGHVIILDEIQLFPPGYVDLTLTLADRDIQMIVAGDPFQANYDNSKDRHFLGTMGSDISSMVGTQEMSYNVLSRRFKNPIFLGRLPCKMVFEDKQAKEENYSFFNSMTEFANYYPMGVDVILVSSFEEKKIIHSYMGSKQKTLTFGESTGLTFEFGAILVSAESSFSDERRWLTALSRFARNVAFINNFGTTVDNVVSHFHGRCLYQFLTRTAIEGSYPGSGEWNLKFFEGFNSRLGKDAGIREEKLIGDPWLKCDLFLGQTPDVEVEEEAGDQPAVEDWFKCHMPLAEMEPVRARWAAKLALKERREFRVGDEVSEQFNEDFCPVGERLTNACETYESIYPRHKGTDSITFLAAVRKRLKFSKPSMQEKAIREAMPYGKFLLKEFLKKVPLDGRHDSLKMEAAVHEFEEKKLSKSAATIENHAGRSCRDWLADTALIFMKSQHCTKFDNRFRDAKAGQTLACFHHSVLCRFAPYMRYIEKKVNECLPKNFYIHSSKNIEDLDEWVRKSGFSGTCTESDYEAFDASQDHFILAFELSLMKHLQLPEDLIADYKYIKTHLGSKLGSFAIMRFTGEASTFLFNTLANMLFTFLRYEVTSSDCIAFAGDDMCANSRLKVKKEFEGFLKKLSLKAKVNFVQNPTFCGWCLNEYGVYKKPQLVWERINIARERNNIINCLDNYAIEVSYAYKLGEKAVSMMSEEDLDNHYLCVRYIIQNKSMLKSDVVKIFVN